MSCLRTLGTACSSTRKLLSSSGHSVAGTRLASRRLLGVPTIEGISTLGGPCGPSPDRWCFVSFDIGIGVSVTTDTWTYLISPAAVDEPASLSLLVIALGVLAGRLRRTKRA